jgi:hypothetical protein
MKTLTERGIGTVLAIAVGGLILIAPADGSAQERFKIVPKPGSGITKYTQQYVLDVGDIVGHQIRVASIQTKYSEDGPKIAGVKEVESTAWLMSDYIAGSGHFTEYAVTQMANGDKIFARIEGLVQTSTGPDG